MENIVIAVHIIVGVAIVVFVLIQQGKGAEAGASFGAGASQTLFGSIGGWNFFSKVTAVLAAVFFVTSFTLAVLASKGTGVGVELLPELQILDLEISEGGEIPVLDTSSAEPASDVPALDIPMLEDEVLEGAVPAMPEENAERE